jgi:hypothetical protein
MRTASALLFIVAVAANTFGGEESHDLRLTTVVEKQSYCRDKGTGEVFMSLSFRLSYTNTGQHPLILYKGSKLVTYVRGARTIEDLSAKKFSLDLAVTWVSSGNGDVPDTGSSPDDRFAILKPGKSWNTYTLGETAIPILQGISGTKVLQVIIPTWDGSREQATRLQKKWEKTGQLWIGNAFSEPVPITIEIPQKLGKC